MRYALAYILLVSTHTYSFAQLFINEVCSKNTNLIEDSKGKTPDWVELYNAGTDTISLSGYGISDDVKSPYKWIFGDQNILPGEYMLIFASGDSISELKEKLPPVQALYGFGHDYTDGTSGGNSYNEFLDFDDSFFGEYEENQLGFSMLINLSGGDLSYSYGGYRSYFDENSESVDFSAFNTLKVVAQISNGRNLFVGFMQNDQPGWAGYNKPLLGTGAVKEYFIPLTGEVGDLELAQLQGLEFFAETYGDTEVRIHEATFINTKTYLHTNFQLSSEGESILLTDSTGKRVDIINFPALNADYSYGRMPDGGKKFVLFTSPTPGESNTSSTGQGFSCDKEITFSHKAGFYEGSFQLQLSGSSEIRYTTDGSVPLKTSLLYTTPLTIDSTTVIKAACFEEFDKAESYFANTYFLDEITTLPVFSLSTAPKNLFDENEGMYADGPNMTAQFPHYGGNFWKEWEKPLHIEFFEEDKTRQINQLAGADIFGGWSRGYNQKSLHIKASEKYGKARFDCKLFKDKKISSFKHFVLRNAGNQNNRTHLLDGFVQTLVKDTRVDKLAYRPSIVYINGEYWGILNIREKINDNYVEDNHGINDDWIDISDAWGNDVDGTNNIQEIHQLAKSMDLAQQENFELVADSFNLESMIDYFIIEIYGSNADWPSTNLKLWRSQKGNRKYNYILYDTDYSFGTSYTPSYNQINRILNPSQGTPNYGSPHAEILKALLNNELFKNEFLNRYADLLNSVFVPEHALEILHTVKDSVSNDIQKHRERWQAAASWNSYFPNVENFITRRPEYAREELKQYFGIVECHNLSIAIPQPEAAIVKLNSLLLDEFPWSGLYFEGIPVEVTVLTKPGYKFSHWETSDGSFYSAEKQIILELTEATSLVAVFEGEASNTTVAITELNYNSSNMLPTDPEDWMEIHNYGDQAIDMSYWRVTDSRQYNEYEFAYGTTLEPDERIVLVKDSVEFHKVHPQIKTSAQFNFSLSNGGEQITLFDALGNTVSSVNYKDQSPWPSKADGEGYTIELRESDADTQDPFNWWESCYGGTPTYKFQLACKTQEELGDQDLFRVYPNPSQGTFELLLDDNIAEGEVKIYTSGGYEVWKREYITGTDIIKIDIAQYPKGVYVIKLISDNHSTTKKIIIF